MNVILTTFIMYIVGMAIVGIIASRYTRNIEDFSLGGRRLGPWVIAISAKATDFSTWLLVGLPGQAFKMGLGAIWAVIGSYIPQGTSQCAWARTNGRLLSTALNTS